jgi:hypothetical protein
MVGEFKRCQKAPALKFVFSDKLVFVSYELDSCEVWHVPASAAATTSFVNAGCE